ncbi:MAG: nucleotidyltransferase domain-containing protein [Kiritimatiellae bacterium]|nr:nucleotidyltransferase domain-containing protein [Kiritimatiellia bacterium]MDW8459445.1 nucleotidyltransferase domain-containing protein [Verrucomicrobiota bacterium]
MPECKVLAFGSRVEGNAKAYSDLDLAIVGERVLPFKTVWRLREAFEESDLPFRVDVVDWHAVSEKFRDVIKKRSVPIQEAHKDI